MWRNLFEPEQRNSLCDTLQEEIGHIGVQSIEGGGIDGVDSIEIRLGDDSNHTRRGDLSMSE
jgi:hypothetical protein